MSGSKKMAKEESKVQLSFDFEEKERAEDNELRQKINAIDPLNMTPLDALNYLYELKQSIKK